ncbi:MAG: hypothetical protein QXH80_01130 [Candidatus Nanoarchaeia archaeon]
MKKETIILIVIFAVALIFRLIFAFTQDFDYGAYYHLRQIEHITKTALPIIHDNLSYGGRTFIITPLFHYILAFFNIFMPLQFAAKLIPNIFATALVFIIYGISKKLTANPNIAMLTAAVSAFIPAFLKLTITTASPYSLAIPLIFLALYFIMELNEKKSIYGFLALTFILPVTSPISLIFIIALLFYFVLVKIERLKQPTQQLELILFATFAISWITFIIHKSALLLHGSAALFQNIPEAARQVFFPGATISYSVISIGLIPLIGGIFTIYTHLFKTKERNAYQYIALVAFTAILLWAKLLQPTIALAIIGIALLPLLAIAMETTAKEIKLTRFANHMLIFKIILITALITTSFIPSIAAAMDKTNQPSKELKEALLWLKSKEQGITLSAVKEGHIVTEIAEMQNVADTNFFLAPNPAQRIADINSIYTTASETAAIGLLNKYNVKYIIWTPEAKKEFNISKINYITDKKCFDKIYDNKGIAIYKSLCKID